LELKRVLQLDGWRAIAVSMVIAGHLAQNQHVDRLLQDLHLRWLGNYAETGVYIFFCISGYVITRGLLSEGERNGRISISAFYVRRGFRIIPPLLLYLLVLLCLDQLEIINQPFRNTVGAFFFVCNNAWASCNWFSGHTWSLAFEEQFYLLAPALIVLWKFRERPHPLILLALGFAVLPLFSPLHWLGNIGFLKVYLLLVAGGAVAANEIKPRFALKANRTLLLVFALVVLIAFPFIRSTAIQHIVGPLFFPIAIPALIFYRAKFLEAAPFLFFGKISYSVYLWQQLGSGGATLTPLELAGTLSLSILAAYLSYEFVEKRFISMGTRHSRQIMEGEAVRRLPA